MKGRVLIAGQNSTVQQELAQCLFASEYEIHYMHSGRHKSSALAKLKKEAVHEAFAYTAGSFLSTRSVFIDLLNKNIHYDQIFIIHSVLNQEGSIQSLRSSEVESRIDSEIKGFVYILREAIYYFESAKRGIVNIVLQVSGPEVPGPFDALAKGSIEGISSSLFTYYSREDYRFRGFKTSELDNKAFAEFITRHVLVGSGCGKWSNFRSTFLSFARGS